MKALFRSWRLAVPALCGLLLTVPAIAQPGPPIIQTRFTADPAPLVHDGVVYLYTSHDEDDATGFKMRDWLLYSSTDMVNWTDRGTVASLKTFPWAVQTNDAWAPQVIARGGKFYLYAPISVAGSPKNVIAVAVADRPEGPFVDVLGKPLIAAQDGFIDPTVWIDDDGQAYLYWGNPDLWYVRLNKDMTSYSGPITKIDRILDYQEGPWFYKRDNRYYMAFASTCCSEGIGYAMSDKPTGPWTYKGPIMDHDARATGNHPGIIDYKDGSYLFGFNYELNFAVTPIHHERRSVTVAKFTYNPDSTIPNLHWWDATSTPQLETLNPYQRVEAETIAWTSRISRNRDRSYSWQPGVTTAGAPRTGMHVTRTLDRTYIKVAGVDFGTTGPNRFFASVTNGVPGSAMELRLDRVDGPVIGTLQVGETGAAGQWTERVTPIEGAIGLRDLYLIFKGDGDRALFDFDHWRFAR
ncbi:glycoside hydrolase family 43 protein [Sphingobium sp. BYY-5]|uniref:glycoside hydrolase family 43 protein n=1 Tax=Sphingobium sp. BYY-5 TaxID=2926400 RepID=UPI001FA7558A|nr:glycoside hydrolase family 43 protein [Sphingobium sp. BYY-5]MCI4592484.1 glycoside hydrolase family 43 protein [Sphingobium sp. BYY-5]